MRFEIIAGIGLALFVVYMIFGRAQRVGATDAHQLVAQGASLVDVRTREEFAAGHVQGAVNIPVQELERRIGELPDKAKPVVVYCRSGARSRSAASLLRQRGYTAVHDLGPMSAW